MFDEMPEPGSTPSRASLPIAILLIGSAPFCCLPASRLLASIHGNCGSESRVVCLDPHDPVLTVWPIVVGLVSLALWTALWFVPIRRRGLRALVAVLVVLPPLLLAAAIYSVSRGAGLVP
jgi:hypothetical protein